MHNFDTSLNGMLLHSNILCPIKYIEQDASHGDQANGEGDDDEEEAPATQPELPPSRAGTTTQMPARCFPEVKKVALKKL
jgi:hypothetical protein